MIGCALAAWSGSPSLPFSLFDFGEARAVCDLLSKLVTFYLTDLDPGPQHMLTFSTFNLAV
jgi:hypothetical protein